MQEDERCCGTGTCLINEQGRCWCGQQWDGAKMCFQSSAPLPASAQESAVPLVQVVADDQPPA